MTRPGSQRLKSFGYEEDEFQELLDQAELNASRGKDIDFVDGVVHRFAEYGMEVFLSDSQLSWLKDIAGEN